MSLFGGLAAAGLGGAAFAQPAKPHSGSAPAAPSPDEIDPAMKAGLDRADADFNQVVIRERVVRRPYRRPRVVRRRVIVRRPVRRPMRRRTIVRRRVIVR